MSRATRSIVFELLVIQNVLRDITETTIDGDAVAALKLSLDFIEKALAIWVKKMESETGGIKE